MEFLIFFGIDGIDYLQKDHQSQEFDILHLCVFMENGEERIYDLNSCISDLVFLAGSLIWHVENSRKIINYFGNFHLAYIYTIMSYWWSRDVFASTLQPWRRGWQGAYPRGVASQCSDSRGRGEHACVRRGRGRGRGRRRGSGLVLQCDDADGSRRIAACKACVVRRCSGPGTWSSRDGGALVAPSSGCRRRSLRWGPAAVPLQTATPKQKEKYLPSLFFIINSRIRGGKENSMPLTKDVIRKKKNQMFVGRST